MAISTNYKPTIYLNLYENASPVITVIDIQFDLTLLETAQIWTEMYKCFRRPLRYERVYLPLHKVADTPFHIQVSWNCTYRENLLQILYEAQHRSCLQTRYLQPATTAIIAHAEVSLLLTTVKIA